MQPSDEEHPPIPRRHTNAATRRNANSSELGGLPSLQEILRTASGFDVQMNIRNAPSDRVGNLSHLQQLHNMFQDLEPRELAAHRTEGQSAQDTSTSNSDSHIGPSHSAILLSEEGDSASLDTEVLRNRLDELGADIPEYMRATANMIRNMTHGADSQSRDEAGSSRVLNASSRQPADAITSRVHPPRTRTSDAASGRYARPRRDSNPTPDGGIGYRRQENNRDDDLAGVLPARRITSHDDDSASTLLGRRVALRAAAAARTSGNTSAGQRLRALPAQRNLLSEHYGPPGAVSGSTSTSRIIVPPRLPDRVSRRIAQFESTLPERSRHVDSDGSETEVDDSVFRPIVVRRGIENGGRARSLGQRTNNGGPSLRLPDLIPVSPFGSPGGTHSTGSSSSDSSPRPVEEERPAAMSSRMQEVYGRLDRLSSALSAGPNSLRPAPPSLSGGDFDETVLLSTADRHQEGENSYQEVVEADEGRTYRIRRHINADGDEQVHQISTDAWWDVDNDFVPVFPSSSTAALSERMFSAVHEDDSLSRWPSVPTANSDNDTISVLERLRRQRHGRTQASQTQRSETDLPPLNTDLPPQNTNTVTRRRRGWARLNHDGDEIPTDEEEEIERTRTEQRVRNSQAAWRNAMSASTSRARLEYLAPTTRSVFTHGTDDDEGDENAVQVRLHLPSGPLPRRNIRRTLTVFSNARKEKEDEPEVEQEFFGTSEPYYIDPLPVPLDQMDPLVSDGFPQSQPMRQGFTVLRDMEMAAR